ncbi:exported hypothetical protein [Desulfarculales bacterium]
MYRPLAHSILALILACDLLLATVCASNQAVTVRGLNRGEARELLAAQAQRDKSSGDKAVVDPAQVEAIADHAASRGNLAVAIQEYGRALSLAQDKDKPRLQAKSAELCLKSHMFVPAGTIFADLYAGDPQNPMFLQGLRLARFAQDKLDEAPGRPGARAVGLSPQLWRFHNALASPPTASSGRPWSTSARPWPPGTGWRPTNLGLVLTPSRGNTARPPINSAKRWRPCPIIAP